MYLPDLPDHCLSVVNCGVLGKLPYQNVLKSPYTLAKPSLVMFAKTVKLTLGGDVPRSEFSRR